jgi:hypothetical protein
MPFKELSSIRTEIFLAGRALGRFPKTVMTPRHQESVTECSAGGLRKDILAAYDLLPDTPEKFDLSLTWEDLREEQLPLLSVMSKFPGPLEIAVFHPIPLIWSGDGTTKDFLLPRRPAKPTVTPEDDDPTYDTSVFLYDRPVSDPAAAETAIVPEEKTNATIFASNPASGHAFIETDGHQVGGQVYSWLRLGDAPADGIGTLVVGHCPLLRVFRTAEDPRQWAEKLKEPKGLHFSEI